jgi:hypothetical protein
MIHVISSMYVGEKFCVSTSEGCTSEFGVDHGLKEGSVLSPMLFILLLCDLPTKLAVGLVDQLTNPPLVGGHPVSTLIYADDNTLIDQTLLGLQHCASYFELHTKEVKFEINPLKTELIYFQARTKNRTTTTELTLGGCLVKCSECASYLGKRVSCGKRIIPAIQFLKSKAITAAAGCLKLVKSVHIKDLQLALMFYRARVNSVITYGLAAGIPGAHWKQLDTVYYSFIRGFLRLPPGTRVDVLGRWSGYMCMQCMYNFETMRYSRRLIMQSGPELALAALIEMWQHPNCPWTINTRNFAVTVYPELFQQCQHDQSFTTFSRLLSITNIKQLKRRVLSNCQSICHNIRVCPENGPKQFNDRFLVQALPGFIGCHWVVRHNDGASHAAQLVFTGTWRWTKSNVRFANVSKVCSVCRTRDTAHHLMIQCKALSSIRINCLQSLKAAGVVAPDTAEFTSTIISQALSDEFTSRIICDYCKSALTIRRKQWLNDLTELQSSANDPALPILSSLRNLYV